MLPFPRYTPTRLLSRALPSPEHRHAALAFSARLANGLGLLLGGALLARALGPAGMGSYGYALFLATAGATLATFGLPSAATRFTAEAIGAGDPGLAAAVLRASARWAAGGVLAAISLAALLSLAAPGLRPPALPMFLLLLTALAARALAAGAAQGMRDFAGQLRAAAIGGGVLPLGALAVTLLHLGVPAALGATAAHHALGAWLLSRRTAPLVRSAAPLSPAGRSRVLRYAGGVGLLLALDAVVYQQSETLFLRAYASASDLGLYATAYGLASQVMTLLPGSFAAALFPALAARVGARDQAGLAQAYGRGLATLGLLAVPLALALSALAGPVLALLYGEPFRAAAPILRLVLAAGAAGALASAASSLLYAIDRQGVLLRIGLAAAALNLTLDALLIPSGGALGAALANGAAQAYAAVATLVAGSYAVRRDPPWEAFRRE